MNLGINVATDMLQLLVKQKINNSNFNAVLMIVSVRHKTIWLGFGKDNVTAAINTIGNCSKGSLKIVVVVETLL